MSWTVNEPINSPKQEADQHPQLFLILAGVRTGRSWDTPGDISEKVPTKQRRKRDKLRILIIRTQDFLSLSILWRMAFLI